MRDGIVGREKRWLTGRCANSSPGWRGRGGWSAVSEPVSPVLEMTEIQTRLLAERGPAVLFENVRRDDGSAYDMPVLVNLFGTVERVAWGMNREPSQLREVGETLAFLRQPEPPGGWREALDMLPLLEDGDGDAAEDGRLGALPGSGAAGRGHRPRRGCRSSRAGRASRRR